MAVWFQVFLSNTNNLHTAVWFQVFLSNTNNLHTDGTLTGITTLVRVDLGVMILRGVSTLFRDHITSQIIDNL